ncbi:hypothetical protein AAC387_Pa02g2255 [Persea americana]
MTLTTLLKGGFTEESRKWLFELFLQFSKERLTVTVYIDVVDRAVKALWASYVGRVRCEFEVSNSVEKKDIVSWIATQITARERIFNVVDSRIPRSFKDDAIKVSRVAVLCTARLPSLRPSMRAMVQMMEDVEPCKFIAVTIKDEKMRDSLEAKNEKLKLSP